MPAGAEVELPAYHHALTAELQADIQMTMKLRQMVTLTLVDSGFLRPTRCQHHHRSPTPSASSHQLLYQEVEEAGADRLLMMNQITAATAMTATAVVTITVVVAVQADLTTPETTATVPEDAAPEVPEVPED